MGFAFCTSLASDQQALKTSSKARPGQPLSTASTLRPFYVILTPVSPPKPKPNSKPTPLSAQKLGSQLKCFVQQRTATLVGTEKIIEDWIRRLWIGLMGSGGEQLHDDWN